MKKTKVTRKDVALAAGVSVTTVTHALSETPGAWVKQSTREHIRSVAKKLGYTPSFVGKSLATGRNYLVGLLHPRREYLSFGFYQEIMIGMTNAMEQDDYNLVMLFVSPERRYLKSISQNRLDGVMVLQSELGDEHICEVMTTNIPMVVVNKDIKNIGPNVACVRSDHYNMMDMVIGDFLSEGCRSLLAVHDFNACDANTLMHKAYSEIIAKKSLKQPIFGTTMIPDLEHPETIYAQFRNSFASGQRWDGVFIDGVSTAEIFIEVAEEFNLKAGRDYHLITASVKNSPNNFTKFRSEMRCYVQNPQKMGVLAWEQLKNILEGNSPKEKILVPYTALNP